MRRLSLPAFALLFVLAAVTLLTLRNEAAQAGPPALVVDRTDDDASATACTVADNDCSFRGAVINSNSTPALEVISLGAGDHFLTIGGDDPFDPTSTTNADAAIGDVDILSTVTIIGSGSRIVVQNDIGRALDIQGAGLVTITGVEITGGEATDLFMGSPLPTGGGGIRIRGISPMGMPSRPSTVTLNQSSVVQNSASHSAGIEVGGGGTSLTMNYTTVAGNLAAGGVGGIGVNTSNLTMFNSTVSGNIGTIVGGLHNLGGTINITNSTFSGNQTNLNAGGITTNSTANLDSVTISNNTSASGPGGILYNPTTGDSLVTLRNTILANNTGTGGDHDCQTTATTGTTSINSQGHNLIEVLSAGCNVTGNTTGNITGQDPVLEALQDNGGPTETHELLAGSPAIDAGPLTCPPPATDQRGGIRPHDGDAVPGAVCDIGAFELGAVIQTPSPTPSPTASPTPTEAPTGTASATPTETATATPTGTPTATPTGTGSATPTGTGPTPSETATATPTPTETATETPTSTPTPTATPAGETLVWGDDNCDDGPNPIDALLTLRHDAGLSAETNECPEFGEEVDVVAASVHAWGDVDCSELIDPVDALKLLRHDAGLTVTQPQGCPDIGNAVTVTQIASGRVT